jgi:molybdopterin converting factor small subunit
MMTVRIFGRLRKVLAADAIELQAATVGEALSALRMRLDTGDTVAQHMLDHAVVLVNGRNVRGLAADARLQSWHEAPLGADDQVTILQQVAGG